MRRTLPWGWIAVVLLFTTFVFIAFAGGSAFLLLSFLSGPKRSESSLADLVVLLPWLLLVVVILWPTLGALYLLTAARVVRRFASDSLQRRTSGMLGLLGAVVGSGLGLVFASVFTYFILPMVFTSFVLSEEWQLATQVVIIVILGACGWVFGRALEKNVTAQLPNQVELS